MRLPVDSVRRLPRPRGRFVLPWVSLLGAGLALRGVPAEPAPAVDPAAVRAQAEQNDPEAQNTLGNLYTNGQGLKRDFAEALKWYRLSADTGFAPAQFNLGLAYELGRGVPADSQQAFRYYQLAAEQGFGPAAFNLGNMYAAGRGVAQDFLEATVWYRQAADKGVVDAFYNLGLAYGAGRGVVKDVAEAARWYKLAADRGFALAQYNLGLLYEDGRGVPQNDAEARDLYRAAAGQGYAPAQNNLGLLYAASRGGTPADPVEAYAWLALAVDNGVPPAGRDQVAKSLTPAQLELAKQRLASLQAEASPAPPASAGSPETEVPVVVRTHGTENSAASVDREDSLRRAEEANNQLAAANQRLVVEKAGLEEKLGELNRDSSQLIAQLQTQIGILTKVNQRLVAADGGASDAGREEQGRAQNDLALARENLTVRDARIADLEKQLEDARIVTVRTHPPAEDGASRKLADLAAAVGANHRLEAQVAELTGANGKLARELDAAQKSAAAPTGPETAARVAQDEAAGKEIGSLQARAAELEKGLDAERANAAREIAGLVGERDTLQRQLAGARTEAASQAAAVAELTQANQRLEQEGKDLKQQAAALAGELTAAQKSGAAIAGRTAEEQAAFQAQLADASDRLGKARQENAEMQKQLVAATQAIEANRAATEKLQEGLHAAEARLAQEQGAAESQGASVAELTADNEKLAQERDSLKVKAEAAEGEVARLTEGAGVAAQQRADEARGAQQNRDALTAQLAQLHRDLDEARAAQTQRAGAESNKEGEREALIDRLLAENSALTAKLAGAQGALDQMAAARPGAPAAQPASGTAPLTVGSALPQPAARIHTVVAGDSLSRISLRYYGTPDRWQDIYIANREQLDATKALKIGMQLHIP